MKKIFLSGGSGFIGRNILEHFGESYEIDAPGHSALPLEDADKVAAYFAHKQYDVIIHAAVKPYHRMAEDKNSVYDVNLAMYYNLKAQVENGRAGRMLVTGTGSEYGTHAYKPNMSEEYFGQNTPKDAGTLSRYKMAEDIENTDLMIYNLRIFGLFGKYEKHDMRFISSNILRQLFGLSMVMHKDRRFSFLYIDDLMTVIEMFMLISPQYKTYNVVPDEKVMLSDILAMIRKAADAAEYPVKTLEAGTATEYTGDNSRLKNEFSDLRFTPMSEAVQKLYDYYKQNLRLFKKEDLYTDGLNTK